MLRVPKATRTNAEPEAQSACYRADSLICASGRLPGCEREASGAVEWLVVPWVVVSVSSSESSPPTSR